MNLAHTPALLVPDRSVVRGRIILSTHPEFEGIEVRERIELQGDQGVVILIQE